MNDNTRQEDQYTGLYGPFARGEYAIGATVKTSLGNGEIIWSFKNARGQLLYVISDEESVFPFEAPASAIIAERK